MFEGILGIDGIYNLALTYDAQDSSIRNRQGECVSKLDDEIEYGGVYKVFNKKEIRIPAKREIHFLAGIANRLLGEAQFEAKKLGNNLLALDCLFVAQGSQIPIRIANP